MSTKPTPHTPTNRPLAEKRTLVFQQEVERKYYQMADGSWLECDSYPNQIGMICREVPASAVPDSVKNAS